MSEKRPGGLHLKANLIAGVLTIIPILVVWFVLSFILELLFQVGAPMERALVELVTEVAPAAEPLLTHPALEWVVAVAVALLLIYSIGAFASHVVGNRLIEIFEGWIARVPGVQMVYSASKKLIAALQPPQGSSATRIVLFDFPYKGVKVIGLVMKTFKDAKTGEDVAILYCPTAPNPTSGYMEIVPVKDLIPTAMTMDEAMTMVVSGGAIAPDNLSLLGNGVLPSSAQTVIGAADAGAAAAGIAPVAPKG